jgi:release factor glutamine methyltransferase
MHTISSAKTWAVNELHRARIDSPSLCTDLLLAFVLGCDRVRILSHSEESISIEAWDRFQGLVQRKAHGEPLQYLTGVQEFYGLSFRTAPGALIPRPETEILVEEAIRLMRMSSRAARFVDVGTGSGCIAVSIAHEIPSSAGWAVDISPVAIELAHGNAVRHGVSDRLLFVQSDRLECFPQKTIFDFILCNPPYVALKDYDSLPSEVRDYEPHTALFGGESGLEFYRNFMPEASLHLAAEGHLLLELGAGQAEQVKQFAGEAGMGVETILSDLQGIPRCLVGRKLAGANHG